jgi:peptidoglycan/LPS O-acetylase OafA/YrhL
MMKKEFSIYLDLVRFLAALLVVIYHSNMRSISVEKLPFSNHGHAAVIVFFVLSGYVISYISATKERTPIEYWSSRLSRFYSLAIPVVLLCPLLDLAGETLAPQFYGNATTHNLAWLRIFTSLTFMNEVWNISIMSFSNVPYWSLCYEMWYYILFAIVMFTHGRPRVLLVGASVLLLGPKIIVLAPIWMLGVVLHRYQPLYRIPQWQGWVLFLASWPLYALFQHYQLTELGSDLLKQWIGEKWHREMTFSKFFLTDYLLALIIAANFVGYRVIAHRFSRPLISCEKVIRWLSGYTFSLYIFHQPLLLFFAAVFNGDPNGKLFYAEVIGATLLSIVVIGTFTEQKRHHLRSLIRRLLVWLMETKWWRQGVTAPLAYGRERT